MLSMPAAKVLTSESLDRFVSSLAEWGAKTIGTRSLSAPQLRVFVGECERAFVPDHIAAKWHFVLPLISLRTDTMLIQVGDTTSLFAAQIRREEARREALLFNSLIIHPVACAYAVSKIKRSPDPSRGLVYLDGYLS